VGARGKRALSNKNKIPLAEPGKRVASARYGDEWIGRLTRREEFMIKRYGPTTSASKLQGGITIVNSRAFPLSKPLWEELEHALFRQEWMNEQYEWFEQWFKDHDFDPDHDEIDRDAFERAFEKTFGSATTKQSAESKHLNEGTAGDFAAKYIQDEEKAGRAPTQDGCERAARAAGYGGCRALVRAAYHKHRGAEGFPVRRGRPKNSPK
jgi:hypothetical protein